MGPTMPRSVAWTTAELRVASAHAGLDLGHGAVLVELHRDESAVGLGHVRLVAAIAGVALDAVDRPARNGFQRRGSQLRLERAGDRLLVAARGCHAARLERALAGVATLARSGGRAVSARRRA